MEEPPYDIETYLTEIDTGQIDADYINGMTVNYYYKYQEDETVMTNIMHDFWPY